VLVVHGGIGYFVYRNTVCTMTPNLSQKAEEIAYQWVNRLWKQFTVDEQYNLINEIKTALRQTHEEALEEGKQWCRLKSEDYAKGFSDAKEAAAKVVETEPLRNPDPTKYVFDGFYKARKLCVERIRALASGSEEGK
jgi:hypothetical protein